MRNQYGMAMGMAMALSAGFSYPSPASIPLPDLTLRKQIEEKMATQTRQYRFKREGHSFEIKMGDLEFKEGKRVGGTLYTIACNGPYVIKEQLNRWDSKANIPEYTIYSRRAYIDQNHGGFDAIVKGQGHLDPHIHFSYLFEPHAIELARPLLEQTRSRFLPQIKKKEKRLPQNNCIDELLRKLK